jgi:High potential iron-sulfur protein
MNSSLHNRRVFMMRVAGVTTTLAAGHALAADPVSTEKLTETDAYAKSMGFKLDTTKADAAKYPRHTNEQRCGVCQLFSGKEGEEWGPCSFFGGRLVNKGGWCRNFKVRGAAPAA